MNDDGMDSLGVDHSNFSLRDEIAYQMNRVNNEERQRSISQIAVNVRTAFASQRNYDGLNTCDDDNEYCQLYKKAKLMPDGMWSETNKRFEDVFGTQVYLYPLNKVIAGDQKAFFIRYEMPKDEEICIELLTKDWRELGVQLFNFGDLLLKNFILVRRLMSVRQPAAVRIG